MSAYVEAWVSRTAARVASPDFSTCVTQTQRRVFQIARAVLGNSADAEEVAQEAYLRAFRRFRSLRDPAKFSAWVSRIAYRLAINHRRAKSRRLVRDTAWQAVRPGPADPTDRVYLNRLGCEIDRLPEKLRAVLLLSAVEGMGAQEVGALLGIPAGTVRSRLHLARKRLLEVLTP